MKKEILFVCVHNSARSQMAEAFLNDFCGQWFKAQSAGLEPGKLNQFAVEAMKEIGIDISRHKTKSIADMMEAGRSFAYVITVCDETSAGRCPVVPSVTARLQWSFPDPSSFQGTPAEKLARTREVRDAIRAKVKAWCAEVRPKPASASA
jgi:arsenate reductase (thioredoxin)